MEIFKVLFSLYTILFIITVILLFIAILLHKKDPKAEKFEKEIIEKFSGRDPEVPWW